MRRSGPEITYLTHRLSGAPPEIMEKAVTVFTGALQVTTAAIISDIMYDLGGDMLTPEEAKVFSEMKNRSDDNLPRILQIVCYLCEDPWFIELARSEPAFKVDEKVKKLLFHGLKELAKVVKAEYLVNDPEGREEISRMVLKALDLVPAGESEEQALDRLAAIDSVERAAVIEKTRSAQKRARELREAMARKEAEEAASKMTRE